MIRPRTQQSGCHLGEEHHHRADRLLALPLRVRSQLPKIQKSSVSQKITKSVLTLRLPLILGTALGETESALAASAEDLYSLESAHISTEEGVAAQERLAATAADESPTTGEHGPRFALEVGAPDCTELGVSELRNSRQLAA